MTVSENQSLLPYNSFKIDAKSRYFVSVESVEDLQKLLSNKDYLDLPKMFLGGGSNILFTQDFEGMTIHLNMMGIEEKKNEDETVMVKAMGGENWHQFVLWTIEKNYGGLENLSLIPGQVGTSPMQNIGAYGVEIKNHFESCEALNLNTLEVENFSNEDCQFGYRESIFKNEKRGQYVLLSVTFNLTTANHQIRTSYGAIQEELKLMGVENPTIKDVSNAVINIRSAKLPDPKLIGNAGSFFKNPTIDASLYQTLLEKHPTMPGYPQTNGVKVPAGWLIEQAGWKGKQIGNVATHAQQALVIINKTGKASGGEVYEFSSLIIDDVKSKFGIELEREVNIV